MDTNNNTSLKQRLEEAEKQAAYFKRLAKEAGDIRLRETEELFKVIAERKRIEKALRRRDAILEAVGYAAEQFLGMPVLSEVIPEVLERLGTAAEVSRIYIFQNHSDEADVIFTSQRYEWVQSGIKAQFDNPVLQNISFRSNGFGRWETVMAQDGIICGDVIEFPESERHLLARQDIKSILVTPVQVDTDWWGFIGFDDCHTTRVWHTGEIEALRAAARTLGAAISQMRNRDKLEAANRTKSEFLANMSHELRTPLNHIMGFVQLVLDGIFGDLNPAQKEYLSDAFGSSQHLLALINDILDLSKVEAGEMNLDIRDVKLRALLESTIHIVKEKALSAELRIVTDLDDVPEMGRVDERKLKQIMYNLLSNAVKFSKPEGVIRLEGKPISGDALRLCGIEAPDVQAHVEITVQDSGIGLSPKDLSRIFNPFEQVEQSASRRFPGTGLGLSLTNRLVEIQGGKIWAESKGLGTGATFRFIIPI